MKEKNIKLKILLLAIISFGFFGLAVEQASAADHYIRSDATGSADGSDWANAYTILPATLTRGDTYYIADGTYDAFTEGSGGHGYKFDDAESGSTYIYITKATASAHGTDTGWDNAYGDGQAVFKGHYDSSGTGFYITKGYYIIDGVTGSTDNATAYGFKFTFLDAYIDYATMLININPVSAGISNIQLKYIEFATQDVSHDYNRYGLSLYGINNTSMTNNILIANNYFHDNQNMIRMGHISNSIIEYNYFKNCLGSTNHHAEPINVGGNINNTVRWNIFDTNTGTCQIAMTGTTPGDTEENLQIYGNLFINNTSSNGLIGSANSTTAHLPMINWKFHNNTVVGDGGRIYCPFNCSGIQAFNNLYSGVNMQFAIPEGGRNPFDNTSDFDYSYFYNCTNIPGGYNAHIQTGTSDPFVDSANGDYSLIAHTTAGTNLGSPYNTDITGNTRTNWDRGAYEYVSSEPDITPPAAPSGLSVQ